MSSPLMCLCLLVDRSDTQRPGVLLGRKLRGLGAGNIVGLGGKVEPGEAARVAAAREAEEEAGVRIRPSDLQEMAWLTFWFPTRPSWDQRAAVFVTERWEGRPAPSAEIDPRWYRFDEIPYDAMWADARHWLPLVLTCAQVTAEFTFGPDLATLTSYDVTPHRTDAAASFAAAPPR